MKAQFLDFTASPLLEPAGKLLNPDPIDTADYDPEWRDSVEAVIDVCFEAGRVELKRQAQG